MAMQHSIRLYRRVVAMTVVASAWLNGSAATTHAAALATGLPAATEKNPPGDIPDAQVFVTYTSPLGFSLSVPEGWARTEGRDGVRFADKYNTIVVSITPAARQTVASAADEEVAALVKGGGAVRINTVRQATLRSGPALLIVYTSNSEPNPVTGKQRRLENNRYLISRGGKRATLDLAAPVGADNVDQWKLISDSFRWR